MFNNFRANEDRLKKVSHMNQTEKILATCIIAVSGIAIGFFAFNRSFMTFDTETDYLGVFLPVAEQLLTGEPVVLYMHPPFYSVVLALVQIFTKDWFTTGLIVSLLSSILVLATNLMLFDELCGRHASWGSMLGLLGSALFIQYSAMATSDVFSFALYSTSLLLVVLAMKASSTRLWIVAGVVIGCALLTRSNAPTLVLLLLAPWLCQTQIKNRASTNFLLLGAGILSPLLVWAIFAIFSGSQFMPSSTYVRLAMTYFAPDQTGDAFPLMEAEFDNLVQVVTYDPLFMAKQYVKDLSVLGKKALKSDTLLMFPLNLFVVPGLLLLLVRPRKEFLFLLIIALAQVLLINFMEFNGRFYLFLLPLFGVAVAECFRTIHKLASTNWARFLTVAVLVGGVTGAVTRSFTWPLEYLHSQDEELGEAVAATSKSLSDDSVIVTRKPHLPFYTNSNGVGFPQVSTLDDLRAFLDKQPRQEALYLYYGSIEQRYRQQFSSLKRPEERPEWLDVVAQSKKADGWVLYRYKGVSQSK